MDPLGATPSQIADLDRADAVEQLNLLSWASLQAAAQANSTDPLRLVVGKVRAPLVCVCLSVPRHTEQTRS